MTVYASGDSRDVWILDSFVKSALYFGGLNQVSFGVLALNVGFVAQHSGVITYRLLILDASLLISLNG